MWRAWEGVAGGVLAATGCDDPPRDAWVLASAFGVDVRPRVGPARLVGDTIFVDLRGRESRQQWQIAHELGHWALRHAGEHDSERAADYVGAALLLPRHRFQRDMVVASWDLAALRDMYPHVPWSVLARRVTHLTDAVTTVWDQGSCSARYESPWRGRPRFVPTEEEAALADACLASGEVIRDGHTGAWPAFEGRKRRVVTLASR